MAIKGMTGEREAFPELGQLRKGGKKQKRGDKEIWGKDLDHFRFTSDLPEVVALFAEVYGAEPKMVNVVLPFAGVADNLDAWCEEYVAGGLIHRCDGETMVLWQRQDGSYSTERRPCPYHAGEKQRTKARPGCKPTARLKVIVPELRRLAYVTVLTNSTHDIRNLDAQLRALHRLHGNVAGIPLQLRRVEKAISTPDGNGGRARRKKWLLSIEAAPRWVDRQLAASEQAALPQLTSGKEDEVEAEVEVLEEEEEEWFGDTGEALRQQYPEDWPPEPPAEEEEEGELDKWFDAPAASGPPAGPTEEIRYRLRQAAGWVGGTRVQQEPASESQYKALGSLLSKAVHKDGMTAVEKNDARHAVLLYVYGVDSGKALGRGEASALISWLKEEDSWDLQESAVAEVEEILATREGGDEPPFEEAPEQSPGLPQPVSAEELFEALGALRYPLLGRDWLKLYNELNGTELERWPAGLHPDFYGPAFQQLFEEMQSRPGRKAKAEPVPEPEPPPEPKSPAGLPQPDFLQVVLPSGKHATKTLGRLLIEDPNYVEWLSTRATSDELREAAKAAVEYRNRNKRQVQEVVNTAVEQMTMRF